jgi:hypothetical protein
LPIDPTLQLGFVDAKRAMRAAELVDREAAFTRPPVRRHPVNVESRRDLVDAKPVALGLMKRCSAHKHILSAHLDVRTRPERYLH